MSTGSSQDKEEGGANFAQAAIGTYEEGLKFVGVKSEVHVADFDITQFMAQFYAGSIADANPGYWDEDYAREQWGGLIASSGLLSTVSKTMPWRPDGATVRKSIVFLVPLPGDSTINSSSETEFFRPLKVGDRLSSYDEIAAISPEKTTRLGTGHFVNVVTTYHNQNGDVIAKNTNSVFRFKMADKD